MNVEKFYNQHQVIHLHEKWCNSWSMITFV